MTKKLCLNILAILLVIAYAIIIVVVMNHFSRLADAYLDIQNVVNAKYYYELTNYKASCYHILITSIFYILIDIITILTSYDKRKIAFNLSFLSVKILLSVIINCFIFVNMGNRAFLSAGRTIFYVWCLCLIVFTIVDILVNSTKNIETTKE